MADLSLTASAVTTESETVQAARLGEAVTAGQAIYQDATDKLWYLADSNATNKKQVQGIALSSGAIGQWIAYLPPGNILKHNAVGTVAAAYVLSNNPGGIAAYADPASGSNRIQIGHGISATETKFEVKDMGVIP